jgi:hypothetical protein
LTAESIFISSIGRRGHNTPRLRCRSTWELMSNERRTCVLLFKHLCKIGMRANLSLAVFLNQRRARERVGWVFLHANYIAPFVSFSHFQFMIQMHIYSCTVPPSLRKKSHISLDLHKENCFGIGARNVFCSWAGKGRYPPQPRLMIKVRAHAHHISC